MSALPPLELSGYRLLEQIGSGGSGVVWRAEGTDELRRPFAIKLFPPSQRDAYQRELGTLRAIEAVRAAAGSRDLVETVAADESDGHGYVVMEYVEGGNLEDRVRSEGPLPPREAVDLLLPVLRGLTLLHRDGILHKDVKPANVLVGDGGRAKLGDFGLARPLDGPVSSAGTPGFCAPELYAGRNLEAGGERLDVYSAGATLYYLLSGEAPIPGRPDLFLLERRRVDRGLQEVLFEALSEEPARRTPSAAALEERLVAWREGRLLTKPPRSGWLWPAAAALTLAVVAGVSALLALRPLPPPPLWDGQTLALAGPAVRWEGGEVVVEGQGRAQALGTAPAMTARDARGGVLAAIGPWGEAVAVDLSADAPRVLFRTPGKPDGEGAPPLCAVATDGRFLALLVVELSAGGAERLEVYDLSKGSKVHAEPTAHGACALAVFATSDGRPRLILGSPDGRLILPGPEPRTVRSHGDEVLALTVDPERRRLLVLGDDRALTESGSLPPSPRPRLKVYALEPLLDEGRLELLSELPSPAPLPRSALP